MDILNIPESKIYAAWDGGIRYTAMASEGFSRCTCGVDNCRHIQELRAVIRNGIELFDEIVIECDESPLWVYKSNAPTPVDTLQFDPQTGYWFNDISPKYAFHNYVDAILNRCPIGVCVSYANVDDICAHGMITNVEFLPENRHFRIYFDNGESLYSQEDAVLPIN